MHTITKMGAQGDVLIRRVDKIPSAAKKTKPDAQGRHVLAHGEVTGHAHAIHRGAVMFRETGSGSGGSTGFLEVSAGGADVVHEEHGTLHLTEGLYEFRRQSEWSDEREPRMVAD